jgi:hypothetical protein
MSNDADRAPTSRAALEPGGTALSQFELDLLVVGYLSAVARVQNDRGVAACRLRMEPTGQDRLSGRSI